MSRRQTPPPSSNTSSSNPTENDYLQSGAAASAMEVDSGSASQSLPATAKKPMPTIGIIGLKPKEVAELNKLIVQYGTEERGLSDDQDHPNVIAIGIPVEDNDHLQSCANLCYDAGCNIIAIAGDEGSSRIGDIIRRNFEHQGRKNVVVMSGNDMKLLAKQIVDSALDFNIPGQNIQIPDFVNKLKEIKEPTEGTDADKEREIRRQTKEMAKEVASIEEKIATHKLSSSKKLDYGLGHGHYSALEERKICGIIGGAGPLASAALAEKLAEDSVDFIHYSLNCAPGKHRYRSKKGPHYFDHYSIALNLFNKLSEKFAIASIGIPCNTAHLNLYSKDSKPDTAIFAGFPELRKKLVDIRHAVFEATIREERLILFGTEATTGAISGEDGSYEEYRIKNFKDKTQKLIKPTSLQQEEITKAIFLIKKGTKESFAEAKKIILDTAKQIRNNAGYTPDGNKPMIILGCTELPLVFTHHELITHGFFDPRNALAARIKDKTNDLGTVSRKSSSDSMEGVGERRTVLPTRKRKPTPPHDISAATAAGISSDSADKAGTITSTSTPDQPTTTSSSSGENKHSSKRSRRKTEELSDEEIIDNLEKIEERIFDIFDIKLHNPSAKLEKGKDVRIDMTPKNDDVPIDNVKEYESHYKEYCTAIRQLGRAGRDRTVLRKSTKTFTVSLHDPSQAVIDKFQSWLDTNKTIIERRDSRNAPTTENVNFSSSDSSKAASPDPSPPNPVEPSESVAAKSAAAFNQGYQQGQEGGPAS